MSQRRPFDQMSSRQNYRTVDMSGTGGTGLGKPRVFVCTSAQPFNVQAFISALTIKCSGLCQDVQYFELPYNDIDSFSFRGKGIDVMILCHSIDNRRFAITDVLDALYDEFLPNAADALGKARVCVMVHDFPFKDKLDTDEGAERELDIFRSRQPTTFRNAAAVMMAGKLDDHVELLDSNWEKMRKFLKDAAVAPRPASPSNPSWVVVEFLRSVVQWLMRLPLQQKIVILVIVAVSLIVLITTLVVTQKDKEND